MIKAVNGEYKLDMDLLIIPHSLNKVDSFFPSMQEKMSEWFNKLAEVNGYEADPNDLYVETRGIEDGARQDRNDEKCHNLSEHWLEVEDSEGTWITRFPNRYLPYSILKDKEEGVPFNFKIPVRLERHEDLSWKLKDVILDCRITPSQKVYLHMEFGNFQELLEKLNTSEI